MIGGMAAETGQRATEVARATLYAAYSEAVAAVQAVEDSREQFDEATELARILGELSQQAAKLRAASAVRIAEAEQLSLAGLANRLSVSRSRAQQLVESGRAGKEGNGDG